MTKEEQMLLKHFEDLSERAYFQNRPCFSDFLDMNSQSSAELFSWSRIPGSLRRIYAGRTKGCHVF